MPEQSVLSCICGSGFCLYVCGYQIKLTVSAAITVCQHFKTHFYSFPFFLLGVFYRFRMELSL